jgi:hypothetical protein
MPHGTQRSQFLHGKKTKNALPSCLFVAFVVKRFFFAKRGLSGLGE